jgi:hypothetical protein
MLEGDGPGAIPAHRPFRGPFGVVGDEMVM